MLLIVHAPALVHAVAGTQLLQVFLICCWPNFTGVHDLGLVHDVASIHAVADVSYLLLAYLLLASMILVLSMMLLASMLLQVAGFLYVVCPTVTDVHALFLVHVFAGTHAVARFLLCWHCCIMLQHDVLAVDFFLSHARKVFRALEGDLTHARKVFLTLEWDLVTFPHAGKVWSLKRIPVSFQGPDFSGMGECTISHSRDLKTFPALRM